MNNNECLALQGQSINDAPGTMTLPIPGASYEIEHAIAGLVKREFSIDARVARAVKHHKPRRHLIRYQLLIKALELAA